MIPDCVHRGLVLEDRVTPDGNCASRWRCVVHRTTDEQQCQSCSDVQVPQRQEHRKKTVRKVRKTGITFVHAMWGHPLLGTWCKILHDVIDATKSDRWYHRGKLLVFAYGIDNYRYLWCHGFEPILVCNTPVLLTQGDWWAQRPCGISQWIHKADAVCHAFDLGAKEVIWLDIDTGWESFSPLRLRKIRQGPAFQGRLRHFKREKRPQWRRDVYHGGCYYCRDRRVFDQLRDSIIQADASVSDEAVITMIVEGIFANGEQLPPAEHRRLGWDSPMLHSTANNTIPSDLPSLFRELSHGHQIRYKRQWSKEVEIQTL